MDYSISFPNLHIHFSHVPKTFMIGSLSIAMYGVIIAIGMLLGVRLVLSEGKRQGIKEDDFIDIAIWALVFSIIGARLYYVAFSWDLYKDNLLEIFNLRAGGLAVYGGVIAGVITGFVVCRIKKLNFLQCADIAMLGVLVGQILGRWGNFFNREVFGGYTNNIFAMQLPISAIRSMSDVTTEMLDNAITIGDEVYISVHPTFLYESIWNLVLLLILYYLIRNKKRFDGEILCLYASGYGLGRFWIEAVRTDRLYIANTNIAVSQLLAGILVVAGIIGLIFGLEKTSAKNK